MPISLRTSTRAERNPVSEGWNRTSSAAQVPATSATALATAYVRAEPGLAATQAAFTYDMLHPFAQLAGRAGEFTVGLGVAVLGWGVAAGRRLPRWLGAAGVAAGCGCAAWAVVTPEHASMLMAGMGLVAAWAVACGGVLFARPHD